MPCSDNRNDQADEIRSEAIHRERKLQKRNDELAKMLCITLKLIHFNKAIKHLPEPIQKWWEEHKKQDASECGS